MAFGVWFSPEEVVQLLFAQLLLFYLVFVYKNIKISLPLALCSASECVFLESSFLGWVVSPDGSALKLLNLVWKWFSCSFERICYGSGDWVSPE